MFHQVITPSSHHAALHTSLHINSLVLSRRVSEKGTLQLSIDADSVRRLLLELPRAARPLDDEADSAAYAHYVEREMAGAVNLVKVMQVGFCLMFG